jgi:tetratricopeptide (TPR) repeat protein/transcriptional regulator with XRE-family HTH domain
MGPAACGGASRRIERREVDVMSLAQPVTFGQLLKRYRMAARMSQETLAERSGLAVRSISDLERDVRRLPHPDTIQRLAAALPLSPQDQAALVAAARRSGATSPAPLIEDNPTSALTPFVGRTDEMGCLARFLAGQESPMLFLGGEPGIGKSRLLHEAAVRAQAIGWRVLSGGCTRRRGQASYEPLTGALAHAISRTSPDLQRLDLQGCAWLSRLLPELSERMLAPTPSWTLPSEQERRLLFAAVRRYLANVAGPSGTLLVLDDLQWASDDALDLLESVIRTSVELRERGAELPPHPLQVVGAYRSTEIQPESGLSDLFADLSRDGLAKQRSVPPLDHREARTFADLLLMKLRDSSQTQGHAPTDLVTQSTSSHAAAVDYLVNRARGVPFFLVSCALELRIGDLEDTVPRILPGGMTSSDTELARLQTPWRVAISIRQRVAALPLAAQQLLSALAVVGRSAPFALLAAVVGQSETVLVEALETACQARILDEVNNETPHLATYQFLHDLIRDTVFQDLSAARRAVLHHAVGDALEALGFHERRAADLAHHFQQSGDTARALPYALLAGDQAESVYAHTEAEAHYRAALHAARDVGELAREAEALEKLGKVVLLVGRREEALELVERALQVYEVMKDQIGELHAVAALLEIYIGREVVDAVVTRAQSVLTRVEMADVTALTPALASGLAAVYQGIAQLYFTAGRYQDQLPAASRAVDLARAAGDEAQLAWGLHRRYIAQVNLGDDEDLGALTDMLAIAERSGQTRLVVFAHNMIGGVHELAGEFALVIMHMEQALVVAERRQDPIHLAWQLHNFTGFLFLLGDWKRARETLSRATSIMQEADPYGSTWQSVGVSLISGVLTLAEGREEVGRRLLEQAIESLEKLGTVFLLVSPTCMLAEADLLAGHAEQARLRLMSLLKRFAGKSAQMLPLLAWAEGALGKEAEAEETLGPLLVSAAPLYRVDALRVRGLLAIAQRQWAVGVDALDEALRMCQAMPHPYAEAKTLWIYGRLELERGKRVAARERLMAALAICDRLGEGLYRPHIERDLAAVTQKG